MKEIFIFLGGVVVGGIGAFLTGFLSSAGSDCWKILKNRLFPPTPEDRIVHREFLPEENLEEDKYRWVLDTSVADWEAKGYEIYRDNDKRRCKRQTRHSGGAIFEEFLMIKKKNN